jgi:predicted deacylase
LVIPVANPVAFARSKRSTPEEDIDFADMNRIFPGVRAKPVFGGGESHPSDRSLTEWMASVISEQFFPRLQYLIDFHCHFSGCALIETITKTSSDGELDEDSFEMSRLFDLGIMHDGGDITPTTATGYASKLGVTTAVAEIGGGGLSGRVQKRALKIGVDGMFNVMRYLNMIPGTPTPPGRQLHGTWQPHVRPTSGGYLLSEYEPDSLFQHSPLGVPVQTGDLLGTVFDPYTFAELEKLYVPTDGILYLCRTSGPVEAGSHAYAVTAYEGAEWIG